MSKTARAKSSSRSKQPLSPAIREVLSSVVAQDGSDDDEIINRLQVAQQWNADAEILYLETDSEYSYRL